MVRLIMQFYRIAGKESKKITKTVVYRFFHGIFEVLTFISILFFLMKIYQTVFNIAPAELKDVFILFGIMLMSVFGKIVFSYLANNNIYEAIYNTGFQKRVEIGDKFKNVNMGYFSSARLGEVTSGLTTAISRMELAGGLFLQQILFGTIQTLVTAIFIIFYDFKAGLIILATLFLALFINNIFQPANDRASGKLFFLSIKLNADILEYISGIGVIKSFGKNNDILKNLKQSIKESCAGFFKQEKTFGVSHSAFTSILRLGTWFFVLSSIYRYSTGSIEPFKAIVLATMSFIIFSGFEMVLSMLSARQLAVSALDKIEELQQLKTISEGEKDTVETADIEFKDVSFSYEEGDSKLFENLNLSIPAGKTVALVGTSGSGKTTVCNLIARFWDVQKGQILLGGTDVKDYRYDSLLSKFSYVFQDVYLFDDTVKNNIKFGKPEASDEEVIEVAKKARCHDFIMKLKEGYDTELQEGGSDLSGGERQRISIARAMLKQSRLVILDEATSSVDPETEEELLAALDELLTDKTVIVIAHRLKTVRNADKIIVMDKGKIVQQGSHDDLMMEGGMYRNFVESRKTSVAWKI